jgi:hypothetical protein
VGSLTRVRAVETSAGNMGFRELDQEGRALKEGEKAVADHALMVTFGGATLIGPVLIMALHPIR